MNQNKLDLFQTFNATRIFLSLYYKETKSNEIGTLCGALNVWRDRPNWKNDIITFDTRVFNYWIIEILKNNDKTKTNSNPKEIKYDSIFIFSCLDKFLNNFYNETAWNDIKILKKQIKTAVDSEKDPVSKKWIKALCYAINDSYDYDPEISGPY